MKKPNMKKPNMKKPNTKKSNTKRLDKRQINGYKLRLIDKKREVTEAYNKNTTYGRLTDDEGSQDLADKASSSYTKEFLYSLSNTDREILQHVDEALQLIGKGAYGTCQECADDLNRKRLEAVPWATYCVKCQEKIEQGLL